MRKYLQIQFLVFVLCFYSKAEQSSPVRQASTLSFTENKGQWADSFQYVADLAGGKLILQKNSLDFLMWEGAKDESQHRHTAEKIKAHLFKINFSNANPSPEIISTEKEKNYRNYFLGNYKSKWKSHVSLFKKITYKNLWNGIDANLYGSGDALKYDFRIQPNANVANVQFLQNLVSLFPAKPR